MLPRKQYNILYFLEATLMQQTNECYQTSADLGCPNISESKSKVVLSFLRREFKRVGKDKKKHFALAFVGVVPMIIRSKFS